MMQPSICDCQVGRAVGSAGDNQSSMERYEEWHNHDNIHARYSDHFDSAC